MAANVFSRVSSASASELQIKRQTLKKTLGLEEHIQGQKCKKDKLLLIDAKWDVNAGPEATCPSQGKSTERENSLGFRQTPGKVAYIIMTKIT